MERVFTSGAQGRFMMANGTTALRKDMVSGKVNNSESYVGEWKNSKAHGYGVHNWPSGDKYEGEWKECLKHGYGTDFFANGDVFSGTYHEGKPYGKGRYQWANGSLYIGDFKNGLKSGKGRWQKGEGNLMTVYEGDYLNDKKHGYGVFRWPSGNYYEGEFCEDERHGKGRMVWTDGSEYEGDWFRGMMKDQEINRRMEQEDTKMFSPQPRLLKNKSMQKLAYQRLTPGMKSKVDEMVSIKDRPKPLVKSKYMTTATNYYPSVTSSLPKLKSPLLNSKGFKNTFYTTSSSRKKPMRKRRGNSQRRKIIRNKLLA